MVTPTDPDPLSSLMEDQMAGLGNASDGEEVVSNLSWAPENHKSHEEPLRPALGGAMAELTAKHGHKTHECYPAKGAAMAELTAKHGHKTHECFPAKGAAMAELTAKHGHRRNACHPQKSVVMAELVSRHGHKDAETSNDMRANNKLPPGVTAVFSPRMHEPTLLPTETGLKERYVFAVDARQVDDTSPEGSPKVN